MFKCFSQIQYGRQVSWYIVACTRTNRTTTMASRRSISQSNSYSLAEKTFDSSLTGTEGLDSVKHKTNDNFSIAKIGSDVDLKRLSDEEKQIHYLHLEACQKGESMYKDPATGYAVFTEVFHRQRNSCCGNACRHCPYNHENVPQSKRTKKFNSAFYCE